MYKIRSFLLFIARLYITFVFRKQKVFVVSGLRRSGNHAFINWFTNALEDDISDFVDLSWNVTQTKTGRTILFNEVNFEGMLTFLSNINKIKLSINNSLFIIISLEDYSPEIRDPYIPMNACKIAITRSTLNIIASRMAKAQERASMGIERGDMMIDETFLKRLHWHQESNLLGWNIWNFDSWLDNFNNYNDIYLSHLDLYSDIPPKMSTQGNGSSFTGKATISDKSVLKTRWQNIEWTKEILTLLTMNRHQSLLTKEEKHFVEDMLIKLISPTGL
jgi:hypothetical protein